MLGRDAVLNKPHFEVKEKNKLYDVECPNTVCGNTFLVTDFTYHREFVCKRCGSEWYAGLPMDDGK